MVDSFLLFILTLKSQRNVRRKTKITLLCPMSRVFCLSGAAHDSDVMLNVGLDLYLDAASHATSSFLFLYFHSDTKFSTS